MGRGQEQVGESPVQEHSGNIAGDKTRLRTDKLLFGHGLVKACTDLSGGFSTDSMG